MDQLRRQVNLALVYHLYTYLFFTFIKLYFYITYFQLYVWAFTEKNLAAFLGKGPKTRKPKCSQGFHTTYWLPFLFFSYSALRNLYAHCIQSPEGQHVGCITDLMPDGSYLTVPVYATICSAMCYESKENMERVKKCPYPGFRKHDPILSKLF